MSIASIFKSIFIWWDGQTLGTRLFTWRKGIKVGEDEQGNVFYRNQDGSKRWVVFNGEVEASRISPDWHGWMHHTFDEAPTDRPMVHKPWEKPHRENLTGSPMAYAPAGSIRQPKPVDRRDYEAWTPE